MNLPIDLTVLSCTFDLPNFAREIFCNIYKKFMYHSNINVSTSIVSFSGDCLFYDYEAQFPRQFGCKKLKGPTCRPSRLVSLRSGGAICDLQIGTTEFFFFLGI
jgi:hypothetical protein